MRLALGDSLPLPLGHSLPLTLCRRSERQEGRGAEIRQHALNAAGAAGHADPPSVAGSNGGSSSRLHSQAQEHGTQLCLDLYGVGLFSEPQEPAGGGQTWVSTGNPGKSKATLNTTFAVLRPTPGRVTRSSIAVGTTPPNLLETALQEQ